VSAYAPILFYALCLALYTWNVWHAPAREPEEGERRPPDEERFLERAAWIFLVWWIAFLLPFFLGDSALLSSWWVSGLGFVVMVAGMVIRKVAIQTLDRHFTYQLSLREDHQLIETGIYRILRHPSYTGTLLEGLGMLLVGRSLPALCLFLLGAIILFTWRIRREESWMIAHFGDAYRAYQARTWRLLPWVF
jgi:protein-S-isoprenylcysteine O-methyltransferase Ste14